MGDGLKGSALAEVFGEKKQAGDEEGEESCAVDEVELHE